MAGKKMSSRSGNSHNTKRKRYRDAHHTENNTARKQANHAKLVELGKKTSAERLGLMKEVCDKLHMSTYGLKKLIGTPNIRRLNDVMQGTYIDAQWFILREKRKQEKDDAKKSVHQTKRKDSIRSKKKRPDKKVSKGSDIGNPKG